MQDAAELLGYIKRSALLAQEASKPVQLCFGRVESGAPLRVNVEQKMTLGEKQLAVPRRLRGAGAPQAGEEVVLARMQGGQTYVLLDIL